MWSYDFLFDRTISGTTLKFLVLMDEFTWECLALKVKTNFKAIDEQHVLQDVIAARGAPEFLRSYNGSEFIATGMKVFLRLSGVQTRFIEPGKPWQRGFEQSAWIEKGS